MARYVLSVSIGDKTIYDYVKKKPNVSHYIRGLIKEDMKGPKPKPVQPKVDMNKFLKW